MAITVELTYILRRKQLFFKDMDSPRALNVIPLKSLALEKKRNSAKYNKKISSTTQPFKLKTPFFSIRFSLGDTGNQLKKILQN